MTTKKSTDPSPESIARFERRRVAAEEGVRAMADVERQRVEVRKNMARLREAREAKEAADQALPVPAPKKRTKKTTR